MSEHLTVGDLMQALERYDWTRIVAVPDMLAHRPLKTVGSIEPDGVVLLVRDENGRMDPFSAEWTEYPVMT